MINGLFVSLIKKKDYTIKEVQWCARINIIQKSRQLLRACKQLITQDRTDLNSHSGAIYQAQLWLMQMRSNSMRHNIFLRNPQTYPTFSDAVQLLNSEYILDIHQSCNAAVYMVMSFPMFSQHLLSLCHPLFKTFLINEYCYCNSLCLLELNFQSHYKKLKLKIKL